MAHTEAGFTVLAWNQFSLNCINNILCTRYMFLKDIGLLMAILSTSG